MSNNNRETDTLSDISKEPIQSCEHNDLIMIGTPIVKRIADGLHPKCRDAGVQRDDLEQSGYEALIKAARGWQPGNAPFEAVVWRNIKAGMIDHIRWQTNAKGKDRTPLRYVEVIESDVVSESMEDTAEINELVTSVNRCIDLMPDNTHKAALRMYMAGYDWRAIRKWLNISTDHTRKIFVDRFGERFKELI